MKMDQRTTAPVLLALLAWVTTLILAGIPRIR